MKDIMVHNIPSLRQTSIKFIVLSPAVNEFQITKIDFNQAYLQFSEEISRDIFIRLLKEDYGIIGLVDVELLKIQNHWT